MLITYNAVAIFKKIWLTLLLKLQNFLASIGQQSKSVALNFKIQAINNIKPDIINILFSNNSNNSNIGASKKPLLTNPKLVVKPIIVANKGIPQQKICIKLQLIIRE
jgi:hypothetical protein